MSLCHFVIMGGKELHCPDQARSSRWGWLDRRPIFVRSSRDGMPVWGTTILDAVNLQNRYRIFCGNAKIQSGIGELEEMELVNGKVLIMARTLQEPTSGQYYKHLTTNVLSILNDHNDFNARLLFHSAEVALTPFYIQYLYDQEVITESEWNELRARKMNEIKLRSGEEVEIPFTGMRACASFAVTWFNWRPRRRIHLVHEIYGKTTLPGSFHEVLAIYPGRRGILECDVMKDKETFSRVTFAPC